MARQPNVGITYALAIDASEYPDTMMNWNSEK